MKKAVVFTDGSSRGNPGPGGWAYIVSIDNKIVEGGGFEENTTNNRMELTGVIKVLEYINMSYSGKEDSLKVSIHTDSSYLINGVNKWLKNWYKNDWKTKTKENVKNEDLWRALNDLLDDFDIDWVKVSGHSGVPGNERVDVIATNFADNKKVDLYSGSVKNYSFDLDIKESEHTKSKKKSNKNVKAYSYVSCVKGVIETHTTWSDCEKRVKGVSGAKFKKSISKEDESLIISEYKK